MRTLLGIAIFMGGIFVVNAPADAARQYKRSAERYYYSVPRETAECERARWQDSTGRYAGYPCWTREVFGRGGRGGRS